MIIWSDIAKLSWGEVPKKYFDTNCEGDTVIVVDSVEIVALSLDPDCVFMGKKITRNIFLFGMYIDLFLFEDQSLVEIFCNL